jgi:protein-S-isoprenylcysteine O-methyltransferase Ste14
MSRKREILSLFLIILAFGIIFPASFYLMSVNLDELAGFPKFLPEPFNVFGGVFVLFIGVFWITWAYSYLHYVGKGSPIEAFGIALHPTKRLVVTGPYAYTRNPMVLGMLFVLLAVTFIANTLSGLIIIPILTVIALIYIKKFEEPGLVKRFGNDYIEYRKRVPILIPGMKW